MEKSRIKPASILMIVGGGLFIIFRIYTWIYDLPTKNNLLATIGLSLLLPFFAGLFLYGKNLKDNHYRSGIVMQLISILFVVAFIITSLFMYV